MKVKTYLIALLLSLLTASSDAGVPTEGVYRFSLGEWECTAVNDGTGVRSVKNLFNENDAGKLLPVLKRLGIDPDRIRTSFNILVLRNREHLVVIDTGMGSGRDARSGKLLKNLRRAKIDPAGVDCVIITHGHRDHIGGLTDGKGRLTFPSARYYMARKEWDYWTSEENLSKLPKNRAEPALKNLPPIKDKVVLLRGNEEIVPGIRAVPASGHTPGMIAVLITSGREGMLHIADAMHFSFQLEVPDVSPIYDMDRKKSVAVRKALIHMAKKNRYKIFTFHFGFPGIVDVK